MNQIESAKILERLEMAERELRNIKEMSLACDHGDCSCTVEIYEQACFYFEEVERKNRISDSPA